MTAEEKLIQAIREALIEKHGEEFINLTEEEQNELIVGTMLDYVRALKADKWKKEPPLIGTAFILRLILLIFDTVD